MKKGAKPSKDISKQTPSNPKAHAFSEFMGEFNSESDRAAVVLGAAKMDALLGLMLAQNLLPNTGSSDELLEGDSPLSTFSARIKMCFRLGLIDPELTSLLHTLRKLRNNFAHEVAQGTLLSGSARDRVLALAEPFKSTKAFKEFTVDIAEDTKRKEDDPGVIFRAVLAMFYLHLAYLHDEVKPVATLHDRSISQSFKDIDGRGSSSEGQPSVQADRP